MNPTGFEPVPPPGSCPQPMGGKVIIDVTKPRLSVAEEARQPFERLKC